MYSDNQIDIVIPWVDGNDEEWQSRYKLFSEESGRASDIPRFREWGLLKYWFRGIEKFMPWVRMIHFVTSGELPAWLNIDHPKLNWVKHEDYIPQEFLPTFSSHVIELNFHRIEGLRDRFIYFNDDMFVLKKMDEEDFFKNGLPCDCAILDPIAPPKLAHIYINNVLTLNRNFPKKEVVKNNLSKWINFRYGKYLLKTLLLLSWREFPGILVPHLPQPYNKKTFFEVWEKEPQLMHNTSLSKFRSDKDVNQWLMMYWHLAKGEFIPSNVISRGLTFDISELSIDQICNIIKNQKYSQICINDNDEIVNFEIIREKIDSAFNTILPDKSGFEK